MTRRIGAAVAFGVALVACAAVGLWKPAAGEAEEACLWLASIDVPRSLQDRGGRALGEQMAPDGEHVLGAFTTPERERGTLRTVVANSARRETYLVIRGTRLASRPDRLPLAVRACVMRKGFTVAARATFTCREAPHFKIMRDPQLDYYAFACYESSCILCVRASQHSTGLPRRPGL